MNTGKVWLYLLALGIFFGLLYLMKFIFPHYEPEEYSEDLSFPETKQEQKFPQDEFSKNEDNVEAGSNQTISPQTQSSEENKNKLQEENTTGSDEYFTGLISSYQDNVLSNLQPGHPRTDVIIRYYKHPPDGEKIYALRNLGFYIHERPVEQTMANYESNAIYYGDNVRKEDLLIVAYTLINQGMPIKNITPSLYHDGWKSNAIEIGADSTVTNRNPLTPSELKELQFDFL